MLKIAYGAAGLAALAALTAGPAHAQLLTHKDISLAMAVTMARTAIETCKGQGYNVSVNVLGRNGEVILGLRNELAGPATFENSMKKAFTARTFRIPSGKFAENVKGNPTAGALFLANIVPAQGALPIVVDGDTIGSIGVSGAPGGDKDEACANAGFAKISDRLN
jgi:uncharacterized protein GlcG (DUF336 family)